MEARREKIILGIAAILFFAAYSWFGIVSPQLYNSPDEMANYFFITRFAENGDFFSPAPLNYFLSGAVHPRSISWNGYTLAPQGFIGLPLYYGWLGKIFSLAIIKFITPLLAVLGALAFYGIIKKIFNRRIAAVSFVLLITFPVYWYYASRYLYSNVPFVSLLMVAVWAAVNRALHNDGAKKYLIVFSISLAASLAMRPNEAVWVLPLFILSFFVYRKGISGRKFFYAVVIMGFLALPVLSGNLFLYGNIFGSGYTLNEAVEIGSSTAVAGLPALQAGGSHPALGSVLAYGFHPLAILKNIYNIFIKYFWYYGIPALLGFLICLFGRRKKNYLVIALLSSAWLAVVYGSGNFTDNPSGGLTLGDSHFRYWLPVFVMMMPLAGLAIEKIIFCFRPLYRNVFLAGGFIFLLVMSVYTAFFSLDDGLSAVKNNLENNYEVKMAVMDIVGPEDIIIAGRQDKIFFPERTVLYAPKLASPRLLYDLKKMKNKNFYYFAIGPAAEEFYTMGNIARIYGFRLKRVAIFGKEALYKLERIDGAFAYLK